MKSWIPFDTDMKDCFTKEHWIIQWYVVPAKFIASRFIFLFRIDHSMFVCWTRHYSLQKKRSRNPFYIDTLKICSLSPGIIISFQFNLLYVCKILFYLYVQCMSLCSRLASVNHSYFLMFSWKIFLLVCVYTLNML